MSKKFLAFLAATWRSLTFIGTVIGLLYVWPDIKGLPDAYGYQWEWPMWLDREKIAYAALGVAFVWIFWIDVRPFIKRWLVARNISPFDTEYLAKDAERVASGIHEILGEYQTRPPTLSRYKDDPSRFMDDNYEREQAAIRVFRNKYATESTEIIETASKYVKITRSELWGISFLKSAHELESTARLLASISARLRALGPNPQPIELTDNL